MANDGQESAIDEAVLAADKGEFISHEAICAWLNSWGSDHELPPPEVDILKFRACREPSL
jgi:RHH-type rel operon transcriptional repressor/antitoxin RelB